MSAKRLLNLEVVNRNSDVASARMRRRSRCNLLGEPQLVLSGNDAAMSKDTIMRVLNMYDKCKVSVPFMVYSRKVYDRPFSKFENESILSFWKWTLMSFNFSDYIVLFADMIYYLLLQTIGTRKIHVIEA